MAFTIITGGRGATTRTYIIVDRNGSKYVNANGNVRDIPEEGISFLRPPKSFTKCEALRWIESETFYQESLV